MYVSSFGSGKAGNENVKHFKEVERFEVTAETAFHSEFTERLYEWWAGYQPGLPLRSEFDILDHRKLVPYLYLYRFNEPDVIEYRLNGEAVVAAIGRSQSGNVFSAGDDDPEMAALADYLMQVAASRKAYCCRGTLAFVDKKHIQFESIDCPLAGADGEISHVVGLLVPEVEGKGLRSAL